MKKTIAWAFLPILLLSLIGCSSRQYKLVCENGNYYVKVEKNPSSKGSPTIMDVNYRPIQSIEFQSISEMREDIRKGKFTDSEYSALVSWADENGTVSVPNIDALLEPIYPTDAGNYKISMQKSDYRYTFSEPASAEYFTMNFDEDMSAWEQQVEKLMDFENSLSKSTEVDKIESEGDGKTYYYSTSNGKEQHVVHIYTFESDGTVFYVKEQYTRTGYSQKMPKYVDVFFAKTGTDFYSHLYIAAPTERPDSEWIALFGWKEYVAE